MITLNSDDKIEKVINDPWLLYQAFGYVSALGPEFKLEGAKRLNKSHCKIWFINTLTQKRDYSVLYAIDKPKTSNIIDVDFTVKESLDSETKKEDDTLKQDTDKIEFVK